jgi:hypothetical protein
VPIPPWVKAAVDASTSAAGITECCIFLAINKAGRIWGDGMSPNVGCRPGRGGTRRHRETGSTRPAPHVRATVPRGGRRT